MRSCWISAFFALINFSSLPSCALAALDPNGVPYPNDNLVLNHQAQQAQLIGYEKKQRNDYSFRKTLSPTAILADKIVAQIRAVEKTTIWTRAGSFDNYSTESFEGEDFGLARPIIGTTDLYKVVKAMPKGSLLHAHLTAMLPEDIVFQTVLNTPGMVLSAATDLSSDYNRNFTAITFAHSIATFPPDIPSIWTTAYVPSTQIPITQAADSFAGGRIAFLAFLKAKDSLSVADDIQEELGVDAIWRKFQSVFGTIGSAWGYEPIVRTFLQDLFGALVDDNIQWIEIRNGAGGGITPTGSNTPNPDPGYWYDLLVEEIEKFKASPKGKDFWGVRFIWTVSRGKAWPAIIADMQKALTYKAKYPQLLAGYDLVSQEDLGRTLSDLAPELVWFNTQRQSLNLTMPYFFHAGETLGDGNSTDDNLFDALFETRRIGHGFSMFKHPLLMDMYRDRDIALEVCLVSNEALRLNGDVLQHPLPALVAHGVPVALSNDDPAIEGQDDAGLSYDFFEAIQGFDNIGLAGLGALAQNSVRYSNFEDQSEEQWLAHITHGQHGGGVKGQHIREWNSKWEAFCVWIVEEFGAKYNVTS